MELDSVFFTDKINQKFGLVALDTEQELDTELVLTEVVSKPVNDSYESFFVTFKGPVEAPLEQKTYRFSNQNESFDVFIVPIETDSKSCFYEAAFNLLKHS